MSYYSQNRNHFIFRRTARIKDCWYSRYKHLRNTRSLSSQMVLYKDCTVKQGLYYTHFKVDSLFIVNTN